MSKQAKENTKPKSRRSFASWDNVGRVRRKTWNKAIELIENHDKDNHRQQICVRELPDARMSAKKSCKNLIRRVLLEIRQALLRHDWKSIHHLHMCLLDEYVSWYRGLNNKVMIISLLSSPLSDLKIYEDFCRMAGGMDDAEMRVFTKTIKRLPEEIPRGFLRAIQEKLFLKANAGTTSGESLGVADAYRQASLPVRIKDEDDDLFS